MQYLHYLYFNSSIKRTNYSALKKVFLGVFVGCFREQLSRKIHLFLLKMKAKKICLKYMLEQKNERVIESV